METDRLIIRRFNEEDLDDFFEYASVEGLGEMAGWPHHKNKQISKLILYSFIESEEVYAIEYKENNKLIGSIGLHKRRPVDDFEEDDQREIGYAISKDYWGMGITVEAVKRLLTYAFDDLDVDIVWCCCYDFNLQSKRVIEKSGFKYYSNILKKNEMLHKSFNSFVHYMNKEDYYEFYEKKRQNGN